MINIKKIKIYSIVYFFNLKIQCNQKLYATYLYYIRGYVSIACSLNMLNIKMNSELKEVRDNLIYFHSHKISNYFIKNKFVKLTK